MLNLTAWISLTFAFGMVNGVNCCRTAPQSEERLNMERIKVNGKWMVDAEGRVRIFHGINSVRKSFPWYNKQIMNLTKLQYYQKWGFNAVRLGMMWSGVEPLEGTVNHTYVNIMQSIVKDLKNHGMYVLLDMHQDVISSLCNSYDGIPRWLVKKFPLPRHHYPWPLKKVSNWFVGYLTEAVGEAFQHLYKNTSRALDHMSNFWTRVAEVFHDETSVLGYEIINEPWAGDIYSNPNLLLPGVAGTSNLLPLYDVINSAIRKVDTQTLVFYEPVTWGIYLNGKYIGTGLPRVPGGDAYKNLSVLSYHYYCWILTEIDSHHSYPFLKKVICDDLLMPNAFKRVQQDIKQTGGSSFLTEFGAFDIQGLNNTSATECLTVMAFADANLQSWTYWDSDFFTEDGQVKWDSVKLFSRPYAQAVAGIPKEMYYDPHTGVFIFTFEQDPTINAPTEIFVPPIKYADGPKVTVSPGFSATFNSRLNIVFVKPVSKESGTVISCNVIIEST